MVTLPAPDGGMSNAELYGTAFSSAVALPNPVQDDIWDDPVEEPSMMVTPPDLSCTMWRDKTCCHKACVQLLCQDHEQSSAVDDFQAHAAAMSSTDRRNFFFEILRRMSVDSKTGVVGPVRHWSFKGIPVCFEGWMILCDISKTMVHSLLQAIRGGAVTAPPDGRMLRKIRQKPAAESVHTWMEWVYENVAEPLAEGHFHENEDGDEGMPSADNYFNWILGVGHTPGAADFQPQRQQRWLAHCKPADLYQQYCDQFQGHSELPEPASASVFYQVLKEWRGILRVRSASQHAKCDQCTMYKLHRKKASSESEREEIQRCYMDHLKGMWADRAIASQYATQSVWSTSTDTSVPFEKRILFLALDGMDECKYKLPRHTTLTKSWEAMWRPTMHNVLIITFGLTESFFLADCNIKKDSNCQASVLCHWVWISMLFHGFPMAPHSIVNMAISTRWSGLKQYQKYSIMQYKGIT